MWVPKALVEPLSLVQVRVEQVVQVAPRRAATVLTDRHIQSREHPLTTPAVAVAVDGLQTQLVERVVLVAVVQVVAVVHLQELARVMATREPQTPAAAAVVDLLAQRRVAVVDPE